MKMITQEWLNRARNDLATMESLLPKPEVTNIAVLDMFAMPQPNKEDNHGIVERLYD